MDAGQPAVATQSAAPGPSQTSAQPATTAANAIAYTAPGNAPKTTPPPTTATVLIAGAKSLRVPSLLGLPVRKVIEQAATAGLEVEITGSGTVREQAPAPGTMVAPGTRIVVRCGR
jgi:cell division protein FtsI (penicillin-binding protein 3)